jgi:hypothetical protein
MAQKLAVSAEIKMALTLLPLPQSGEFLLQKFRCCLRNSGFASIGRAAAWEILDLPQSDSPLPQRF